MICSALGVAGRFFAALGKSGVNCLAISQGSSETNISAVVMQEDSSRALRAVHAAFRLSQQTLGVGVRFDAASRTDALELLELIHGQIEWLHARFNVDLLIRGVYFSGADKECGETLLLDTDAVASSKDARRAREYVKS